jgi:putative phage-type endonuclease
MLNNRHEFHRQRQTGIGGSDVGAIVGVDPYRNALDVYLEKTGEIPEDEQQTAIQERGHYLEPVIRQLYKDRTGRRLKPARFRRHRDHTWMIGHPDSLVGAKERVENVFDERGILECKTMMLSRFRQLTERGIPEHHQLQALHYAVLCGHRWAAVATLQPDTFQFIAPQIEVDPSVTKQMVEVCETFWFENVAVRRPPTPKDLQWTVKLPEAEGALEIRTDARWRAAVERYLELRAMQKEAGLLLGEAKQELQAACGGYGAFEGAGARVYYRERERAGSLDAKWIEAVGLIDPIALQELLKDEGLEVSPERLHALRADLDSYRKKPSRYEELRVYHSAEAEASDG